MSPHESLLARITSPAGHWFIAGALVLFGAGETLILWGHWLPLLGLWFGCVIIGVAVVLFGRARNTSAITTAETEPGPAAPDATATASSKTKPGSTAARPGAARSGTSTPARGTGSAAGSRATPPKEARTFFARPDAGSPAAADLAALLPELIKTFAALRPDDSADRPALERLLARFAEFLGVSDAQIYLIDATDPHSFELAATFPVPPATTKRPRFTWVGTCFEAVVNEGGQYFPGTSMDMPPIPTVGATPLFDGVKLLGMLNIEKAGNQHITPDGDQALLLFLLGQILGALISRNRRLAEKDQAIATLERGLEKSESHRRRLENTTSFLDKEVDRHYFQMVDLDKQRSQLTTSFNKFVSPLVIQRILKNPDELKLGGSKQQVTIFFADIRGFTSISERLDPTAIVNQLNEYFSVMTTIVLKYQGTLDKFVGDEIMALFGAPLSIPDASWRAVLCALEMQKRLESLRLSWRERRLPELTIGIGITTGLVTVGFLGSESILSYTAIGDSVNLASRLCDQACPGQILIGRTTAQDVAGRVHTLAHEAIPVKGKEQPIPVYEVLGPMVIPPFANAADLPPVIGVDTAADVVDTAGH